MKITNGQTLLLLGGARSGKSALGEEIALSSGLDLHYIATAFAGDTEMSARIAAHQERRGDGWTTHEVGLDIAGTLGTVSKAGSVILIDCLTLWLSNLMEAKSDLETATRELCEALARSAGGVILISNEVGNGIVPANKLARDFRDEQGRLNQRVAKAVDSAALVVAGLPMILKSQGVPANG